MTTLSSFGVGPTPPPKLFLTSQFQIFISSAQLALTIVCTAGVVTFQVEYAALTVFIRLLMSEVHRLSDQVEYTLLESNMATLFTQGRRSFPEPKVLSYITLHIQFWLIQNRVGVGMK
ncbi:MAG: hypothetical protein ACD_3C00239G0001 [uncultured bacterium (gcode 4)]|uniref:Uncharacterized protein n=1 Tax=uncultured bacterium (gcode 4) TaxID=1234023 RepID=K2FZ79_9BACT|nr:MAG: hypothetical protein ACD_3C00239G0001 [uncultured bacterium (gcode 4)]